MKITQEVSPPRPSELCHISSVSTVVMVEGPGHRKHEGHAFSNHMESEDSAVDTAFSDREW